ncbi:hypothetical protein F4819DRAFT_236711 [Hypoxylon fuscum]|nr:hypothetical protein F4819DRAFT_236711 [Hypoxylon fuscum]
MASRPLNDKHRITKRAPAKAKSHSKTKAEPDDRVLTDVLLSIKAVHLANIVSRQKNHEYRKYRLRDGVERLWLYETAEGGGKTSITHIAVIPDSVRHVPGSVPTEPFGIGNEDFNAGLKQSKYGYPILELYELVKPVTLAEMKSKWAMGTAPMGWRYVGSELWKDRWGESSDREDKVKKVF